MKEREWREKKKNNIRREIMFNDVFPGVGIIAITNMKIKWNGLYDKRTA